MNITKEEALAKIEELKKYVGEQDKKVEEKVLGIAIKNRWTGSIIFQSTKTTYKEAVVERLAGDADLRDADLCGANLCDADLCGANLCGADLCGANLCDADLCGAELMYTKYTGKGGTTRIKKSQLSDFLKALGIIMED